MVLNFGNNFIDQPHQILCIYFDLFMMVLKKEKKNVSSNDFREAAVLANFCTAGCPKQGVLSNNNFKAYLSC